MRILLWITLGFEAACAAAAYAPYLLLYILTAGGLLTFFGIGILKKKKVYAVSSFLVLTGFLVGLGWYDLYSGIVLAPPKAMDGFTGNITVTCADYSYASDYGTTVEGTMYVQGNSCRVKVYMNGEKATPGDRIYGTFRMRYTALGGQQDPTFHKGEGIFLLAYPAGDYAVTPRQATNPKYIPAYLRNVFEKLLDTVFPADTAPFARALLLGDSSQMDYETLTEFSVTGIRHVIAVSGLHVAILFSFLGFLTGKRRIPMVLIGSPMLLLFAAMAGFTPSIVRACIMQLMMLLAMLVKKEYDPLTALSFAVLAILAVNPLTVTSVSFQLSVGSMIGILLFSGKVTRRILSALGGGKGKGLFAQLARGIASSAGVSLSAMVFTTPLAAAYFGTVSLIGIISNLLTLWVISFVFCGIIVACLVSLVSASLGSIVAWIVSWPIRYVLAASKLLAKLPVAAVYTQSVYIVAWLVFCYVLFGIYLLRGRKQTVAFCLSMVMGLCMALGAGWLDSASDNYRITMLDVGQGQCILLQSDGRTYMVDCGGDYGEDTADLAAQTLLSQGITRLDGMILTHYDEDHSGGAEYFLHRIPTDLLVLPNMPNEDGLAAEKTVTAVQDMEIAFADTVITVFASQDLSSSNESSLCVLFQAGKCDILITGDRDMLGELELLGSAELPQLDILVAGHHGAASSTSAVLLQALRPTLILISAGEDNPYGHPDQETLDRIEDLGAQVRRTDLEGTIIIRG